MFNHERWKRIDEWPEYDVSDHGRVRSWISSGRRKQLRKEPRILRNTINAQGYPSLGLSRLKSGAHEHRTLLIHRLVAIAFVDGDTSLHVAHLDGNRRNAHHSNLTWATRKVNESHKKIHGRQKCGVLTASEHNELLVLRASGMSYRSLVSLFCVSLGTVYKAVNKPYRPAKGALSL